MPVLRRARLAFVVFYGFVLGSGVSLTGPLPVRNPGFEEDADRDGVPDGWRFYRDTVAWVSGPESSRSGIRSVRIRERGLTAAFPVSGEGFLTVGGYFRGGKGGEKVSLQISEAETPSGWAPVSSSYLPSGTFVPLLTTGRFTPRWTPMIHVNVFAEPESEVYADDFFLFDNRIENADFRRGLEGWFVTGEVWVRSSRNFPLKLSGNAGLFQRFAAEAYGTSLVACRVKAACAGARIRLSLEYSDPTDGTILKASKEGEVTRRSSWTAVCLTLPATACLGTMRLEVTDASEVLVGRFAHAALLTPHRYFSPNGDGIRDDLPVTAWLSWDATACLDVRDENGNPVRMLRSGFLEGNRFHSTEWDGTDDEGRPAEPGTYRLVLRVYEQAGLAFSCSRSVELGREPVVLSSIPPFPGNRFIRGYWMVVHQSFNPEGSPASDEEIEEEYSRLFEKMRVHHGNAAVPAVLDLRYGAVRRAAERYGILQIPSLFRPELLLRFADPLEEDVLRESFRRSLRPWIGSPVFYGVYPLDEPPRRLLDRIGMADRMLATVAPGTPSFHSLADLSLLPEFLDRVRPPIVSFHDYPFDEREESGKTDRFLERMEAASEEAFRHNRPFWAVLQTFAVPGKKRFPSPVEYRLCANLVLALGAKGLFSFLFNSSDPAGIAGLVNTRFEEHPLLHEVGGVYRWIEENEGILLDLRRVRDRACAGPPGWVRTHQDSDGRLCLMVVNRDLSKPRKLTVTISGTLRDRVSLPQLVAGFPEPDEGVRWDRDSGQLELVLPPGGLGVIRLGETVFSPLPAPEGGVRKGNVWFARFKERVKARWLPGYGNFSWKEVSKVYRPTYRN